MKKQKLIHSFDNLEDPQAGVQADELIHIRTKGNGRCAYNGFALGLVDLVFANMDHFSDLAAQGVFADFLKVRGESWTQFVQFLRDHQHDPEALEDQLSVNFKTLLRGLMRAPEAPPLPNECRLENYPTEDDIEVYLIHMDNYFSTITNPELSLLLGDFYTCLQQRIINFSSDQYNDVYVRCPAIQAKFRLLHEAVTKSGHDHRAVAIAKMQLLVWFCSDNGFDQFRDYICDIDNHNAWGGQMELRLLANYWQVGLYWFRFNSDRVHLTSGVTVPRALIDGLDSDYKRLLLVDRNVIGYSPDDQCYEVNITDVQKIVDLCAPLPEQHFKLLTSMFQKARQHYHQDSISHIGDEQDLEQYQLADDVFRKLKSRQIISEYSGGFKMSVDDMERLTRYYRGIPMTILEPLLAHLARPNNLNVVIHLRLVGDEARKQSDHWMYDRLPALSATWPELDKLAMNNDARDKDESKPGEGNSLIDKVIEEMKVFVNVLDPQDKRGYGKQLELYLQSIKHSGEFFADVVNIVLLDYYYRDSLSHNMDLFVKQNMIDMISAAQQGLQNKVRVVCTGLSFFLDQYSVCMNDQYANRLRFFLVTLNTNITFGYDRLIEEASVKFFTQDLSQIINVIPNNDPNITARQRESMQAQLMAKLTTILDPLYSLNTLVGRYQQVIQQFAQEVNPIADVIDEFVSSFTMANNGW